MENALSKDKAPKVDEYFVHTSCNIILMYTAKVLSGKKFVFKVEKGPIHGSILVLILPINKSMIHWKSL